MKELVGEWGDGVCSSRDEDIVPALLSILERLYKDGVLTGEQADKWREYVGRWHAATTSGAYIWEPEETSWLIQLVEECLPAGLMLQSIPNEWADRCVYVDYDPQYRIALVVPDDQAGEAWDAVEDATGEAELDSAGRITVPYEFLQEATDFLDLFGIKYTEVWE